LAPRTAGEAAPAGWVTHHPARLGAFASLRDPHR